MKRGRVPKGFLSSNTAYMLVYKRLTMDWRTNGAKKVKLKKPDETNAFDDAMEKPVIKDIKSDTEVPLTQKCSEAVSKLNLESRTEPNEVEAPQKTDTPIVGKNGMTEPVNDTNELSSKDDDSVSQQLQSKVQYLKQPVIKVVKLDYKRLNGAAHRAMSCGEREFYEEVLHECCMLNF